MGGLPSPDPQIVQRNFVGFNICISRAPASGLLGRPRLVLNTNRMLDRHMCAHCTHLKPWDQSRFMITAMMPLVKSHITSQKKRPHDSYGDRYNTHTQKTRMKALLKRVATHPLYEKLGQIKPGIAETTRAVWRRSPAHLWIKNPSARSCIPLMHWINTHQVPWTHVPNLELGAVALNAPKR